MEAINGIKVFAMNDTDLYAGATEDDALLAMAENLSFTNLEACRAEHCTDGPIVELSDEEMDKKIFLDEEGVEEGSEAERRTFGQQLVKMIADGHDFPCMFATFQY